MLDAELKSKINQLWQRFWSGGISNPLQSIEQMSYLLFMKRLEDEDVARQQNARLAGQPYQSIFDKEEYKWSIWSQYTADKILPHVRDKLFPWMRTLGGKDSYYGKYMKDASFIIPTAGLLIEAVKIIDSMHIKDQNRDTKGDMYEYLLSELKTAGKNGQFRTPRHIIKMMVQLVNPTKRDKICDPACGTAGFLVAAYEHILRENTSPEFIKKDEQGNEYGFKGDKLRSDEAKRLREEALYGFDFDQTMVRISLMNLAMHGLVRPNIEQENTLSRRFSMPKQFDVVLANPPFTGSLEESEVSDDFRIKTTKTELLFLELMYNILDIGGRCAVIVPAGVLFSNSNAHREVRKLLLERCRMDAVISMPSGIFKPYAGVATAVLIFTKGEPTEKVWFYDMRSDGYSLDDKRTFIDGKGDIPDIVAKAKTKEPGDNSIAVTFDEIKNNDYNLSIARYKQEEHEEVSYDNPKDIINRVLKTEEEITKELSELKMMIK